jgi:diguanylate cyclase (GGDEF)-like protein
MPDRTAPGSDRGKSLRDLELLRDVVVHMAELIAADPPLESLFSDLATRLRQAIPAERLFVALLHRNGTVAVEYLYEDGAVRHAPDCFLARRSLGYRCARQGKPYSRGRLPRVVGSGGPHADGLESSLFVPLNVAGETIGVLCAQTSRANAYRREHVLLFEAVASHFAISVANVHLRELLVQVKEAERQAREQAVHDPLTGLPNRIYFETRLAGAIARARRTRGYVGVLYIDFDDFKLVNDVHGHAVGDATLKTAAQRLSAKIRASDVAARLGGDEFAMLIDAIKEPRDMQVVAEKIRASFREPLEVDGLRITMSLSIGSAVYPDDGLDLHALVDAADKGMYAEKRVHQGTAGEELPSST